MDGCWVVWSYGDGAHADSLYDNEIDALRAAVLRSVHVTFVGWGEDLWEALGKK